MNNLYPVFLDITDKTCVLVGGGAVALRKAKALLSSGAHVKVISPEYENEFDGIAKDCKNLILNKKCFEESDLEGAFIVVAATNDRRINQLVSLSAKNRGLLINVVDDPELCNFYVPALVNRGDVTIAVSTGGKCPALAKKTREMVESSIDLSLSKLTIHLSEARKTLIKKFPGDPEKRGVIMGKIVNCGIVEKAGYLSDEDILKEINKWL